MVPESSYARRANAKEAALLAEKQNTETVKDKNDIIETSNSVENTDATTDVTIDTTIIDTTTANTKQEEQPVVVSEEKIIHAHKDEAVIKVDNRTTAAAMLMDRLPKTKIEYILALTSDINVILKELCVLHSSNNVVLEDITSTCGVHMFEYIVSNSNNAQVKVLMNIINKEVK